jgi:pimeloyl-ACP methyl ester carboxylesterase
MDKIISRDGAAIAYQRSGAGTPLVLVHGTGAAPGRWAPVRPSFEKQFTVYAMDRRGRGESGDALHYAIAREFEDVAALVDSIGEPADVVAHSFGALCALEAGLLTANVRRLVLYEPPLPLPGVVIYPEGFVERLQSLLDAGDREGVATAFMREVVRMPPHEFALFRASPAWPARLAAAHTLPRELRTHAAYRFEARRFKALTIPTLLLLGGDSPEFFKAAIAALEAALPKARVVVMPGQQHIAMDTAPDLLVREVLEFLAEPDTRP